VAWDSARKDWRTFRVDRIQRVTTGLRFAPRNPPSDDLGAFVTRGVWNAPPCRAVVTLLVSADVMTERWPPGTALIESIDRNRCKLELRASTFENLAMYLLFFGVDFEVSEPPELMEQLERLSDRIGRSGVKDKTRSARRPR
jgi:predicted DNA-binding transcriptional regulator YafY